MTATDKLKAAAAMKAYDFVDKNPERNIQKLIAELDGLDEDKALGKQLRGLKTIFQGEDNNWKALLDSLFTDIDPTVRRRLVETFVINGSMLGIKTKKTNEEKYGCNIPWAILMDPTSACNLRCTGCWAADYGRSLNMSYETLDSIIRQGKELGTYFYLYSGGEPLVRKKDIIRLCEAHPDCAFLAFTNGTLIDEAFADDMLRVGNFIPAISVEGFEEATDGRRGEGTFKAVMKAMNILREKKLPFGASCCYTSQNVDSISSEEYIDLLVDSGAKFAWFFHYMPVGNDAVAALLPSPAQREKMYHAIRGYRQTKPIFTIDFQNDGEFVGGCIAGSRSYIHINANGDMEPCAFIHYSDSNIKDKTLLQAYQSPLFMAYRAQQPFNENLLMPCPMLENPERLRDMVLECGAKSTDMQSPEDPVSLCEKCRPYAEAWKPTADRLWAESSHCSGGSGCGK